jgi:hypothetical protein
MIYLSEISKKYTGNVCHTANLYGYSLRYGLSYIWEVEFEKLTFFIRSAEKLKNDSFFILN